MPSDLTVRRQVAGTQRLTIAPLLGSVIAATPTAFQLNSSLDGGGGGVNPLIAGGTGIYQGTGRVLHIAATGNIVGVPSTTLSLSLYQVPASSIPVANTLAGAQTFTTWNLLAVSTVRTIGAVTASFTFDARLSLDASGNLEGQFTDEIISLVDVYSPTMVAALTGEADLNFVLVATLAGAETGVIINLQELRLDLE